MIRIKEFLTDKQYEASCDLCSSPIVWKNLNLALSPYYCPKCRTTLTDFSALVNEGKWRIEYHLGGEKTVACNHSFQGPQ